MNTEKIKTIRYEFEITQEKLASKLNTTHSVINAYESRKNVVPTLFMIAKITKKSLNWFKKNLVIFIFEHNIFLLNTIII